jgi:hypothetical protein
MLTGLTAYPHTIVNTTPHFTGKPVWLSDPDVKSVLKARQQLATPTVSRRRFVDFVLNNANILNQNGFHLSVRNGGLLLTAIHPDNRKVFAASAANAEGTQAVNTVNNRVVSLVMETLLGDTRYPLELVKEALITGGALPGAKPDPKLHDRFWGSADAPHQKPPQVSRENLAEFLKNNLKALMKAGVPIQQASGNAKGFELITVFDSSLQNQLFTWSNQETPVPGNIVNPKTVKAVLGLIEPHLSDQGSAERLLCAMERGAALPAGALLVARPKLNRQG